MNEFFALAYAVATNRFCLFTGTGFSKAISDNQAPSWQKLLEDMCDIIPNGEGEELKKSLFPPAESVYKNPLTLEESAQIIMLKMENYNKSLHSEIAKKISEVKLSKTIKDDEDNKIRQFLNKRFFSAVTTNYDKLLEELTSEDDCLSIAPGRPIPRSTTRVNVYHVHGSIDSPENMVVTSNDYFKFINEESYFSRKLSTLLYENTVVILGYSLSDTNLKAIINNYKSFSRNFMTGTNLFFISRSEVQQSVKDYYVHCYGIIVIDNMEIVDFFAKLEEQIPKAEKIVKTSIQKIKNVISKKTSFPDDYLKIEQSFIEIISSLPAAGYAFNDSNVTQAVEKILKSKIDFTQEAGAWLQYEHLASWLIYLATNYELKNTPLEDEFLKATLHSMEKMSKNYLKGTSWAAYKIWSNRWANIQASNRIMIKNHIEQHCTNHDALSIVQHYLLAQ